jgi:hypothetical protein
MCVPTTSRSSSSLLPGDDMHRFSIDYAQQRISYLALHLLQHQLP